MRACFFIFGAFALASCEVIEQPAGLIPYWTTASKAVSTEKDRVRLIQVMQQMESIGILLGDAVLDFDLVDKTLGSFVTTTWEKCKLLVLDLRHQTGDPYLSEYFQWMAEQIDKKMKEERRKPFFQLSKTAV